MVFTLNRHINLITNHWFGRIISYLVILIIFIFFWTDLSYLTFKIANPTNFLFFLITDLSNFLLLTLPIFIIELVRRTNVIKSLNLTINKFFTGYLIRSLLYAISPFLITLILANFISQVSFNKEFQLNTFVFQFLLTMFFGAAQEEIIFRGFILQSLNMRFSNITSIAFSSILFALVHSLNPYFSFYAAFNTFLAGALLGFMYIKTRSLWLPLFYHFFWNLFQALIIGSNVSGQATSYSLFNLKIDGTILQWLFGNDYGFENSILCTFTLIATSYFIVKFETLNPYNSSYTYKLNYQSDKSLL